jgi:nitrogen fixation protein FixH
MTTRGEAIRRRARDDRWIPWAFVAFFGVVFAANGAMVAVAVATWTGMSVEGSPYDRGLAYNETLAAARAQEALGWRVGFEFESHDPTGGALDFTLADRAGHPLPGALVRARFVCPSHQGHDFELDLPETATGRYGAEVELPLPGLWEVRVRAARGGHSYQLTERILAR